MEIIDILMLTLERVVQVIILGSFVILFMVSIIWVLEWIIECYTCRRELKDKEKSLR